MQRTRNLNFFQQVLNAYMVITGSKRRKIFILNNMSNSSREEDNPEWDVVMLVIGSYIFQLLLYN